MPVSVSLRFQPPAAEDIVKLEIWESSSQEGSYARIDETTSVGTFPDYIDNYTTQAATSVDNWFAIQWQDAQGAISGLSEPLQGSALAPNLVLAEVLIRAKQRDPLASEAVLGQEAEATVEMYFNRDPYGVYMDDLPEKSKYRVLRGLTNLSLARSYTVQSVTSGVTSTAGAKWTAGIISMDNSSSSAASSAASGAGTGVDDLYKLAMRDLGLSLSYVMLLKENLETSCQPALTVDLSRTMVEI